MVNIDNNNTWPLVVQKCQKNSFKRWKSRKNNGKIQLFLGKIWTNNLSNEDHNNIVDVFFFNNDNVQTLKKISIELAINDW